MPLRFISTLFLAPLTIAAVYWGTPAFELLLFVTGAAMAWEWDRMSREGRFRLSGWVLVALIVLIVAAGGIGRHDVAFAVIGPGIILLYISAFRSVDVQARWTASGALVIVISIASYAWLRSEPAHGRELALWLLLVVWAMDIGAYFVGRAVGGPRLAPRISPNKTWAGLVGGAICAGATGVVVGVLTGIGTIALFFPLGIVFAILAQTGDLTVSVAKRRFGVKDSSNLIPGHGGVLDRVDGLLTCAPAMAALALLAQYAKFELW